MLKPAPTRLRLVLWSLANGFDEFPEAPPPGLVTVPSGAAHPDGYHTMSGYRAAGERAIRIDMLERLADMLRNEDSRGGFEAKADMLSITGMTLDQFAELMQGLGYKVERGEREKQRASQETPTQSTDAAPATSEDGAQAAAETPVDAPREPEAETPETPAPAAEEQAPTPEPAPEAQVETSAEGPETEVFYTFSWAARPRGNKPQDSRKPKPKPKQAKKGKPRREDGPKTFSAKPKKSDKIDPDNPFAAALMGLRNKD